MSTRRNHVRVCVLGATFETSNMGVSALTAGTITCILHQWPEAEVFLLDYGKQASVHHLRVGDRRVPVPLVNMRFSKRFYLRNNIAFLILLALVLKILPSARWRKRVIDGNECLRQITEADLVVAISGGDSFSDIYGLGRLAYVCLPQILALLLGKDLTLLPQTHGPFRGRIARRVARYILARAKVVYSRDNSGLEQAVAQLRLPASSERFRFCYDVAFALDPICPATIDIVGLPQKRVPSLVRVGMNVSGLLAIGGYTRKNMFGLQTEYTSLTCELIRFLIESCKAEVLLVPHVFGSHEESDESVCAKLHGELKGKYENRLGFVRGRYDQSEIKYIIGACDFFVGARMHACIAALSQNVPAVAIAYSDKFIGVLDTIGMGVAAADARKMKQPEIVELVDRVFRERATYARRLALTMPEVRETVLGLFSELSPLTIGPSDCQTCTASTVTSN